MRCCSTVLLLLFASVEGARRSARAQQRREERSAEAVCAISGASVAYAASGQLTTSYQPGKMAYYRVRKPLALNVRAGIALAAAAAGMSSARACLSSTDSDVARALRNFGRMPLSVLDGMQERRVRAERRRRAEEREEWLRTHSRPAKIYT